MLVLSQLPAQSFGDKDASDENPPFLLLTVDNMVIINSTTHQILRLTSHGSLSGVITQPVLDGHCNFTLSPSILIGTEEADQS